MPRDLSDVLHYFLPELEQAPAPAAAPGTAPSARRRLGAPATRTGPDGGGSSLPAPAANLPLSILGIPLGTRELVHAACIASLAVETAHQGGSSVIVEPEGERERPLWPLGDLSASGVELVVVPTRSLGELARTAREIARTRGQRAQHGGIVFTRIPPSWLRSDGDSIDAIRWFLLFGAHGDRDDRETFERMSTLSRLAPGSDFGIAIQGAARIGEARARMDSLAARCESQLGVSLARYGILVPDLDVVRAIATGRAPSSQSATSPASHALWGIARQLYEDARSRLLG